MGLRKRRRAKVSSAPAMRSTLLIVRSKLREALELAHARELDP